jgi:hypothetical protein
MVRRRWSRIVLAMAVAGATFGIVTVVQAAIPDAQGIAHGCVAKNVPLPNKTFLRMVDTERGESCLPTEWVVNFAASSNGIGGIPPTNDVYYGSGEVFSNNGTQVNIASVAVPAGSYLVTATGWMAGLTAGLKDARCFINSPTGDATDTFTSVGLDTVDIGGQTSWAVQKLISTAGGSIFARCFDSAPAGDNLYGAQITALEVGVLHGSIFSISAPGATTSTHPSK